MSAWVLESLNTKFDWHYKRIEMTVWDQSWLNCAFRWILVLLMISAVADFEQRPTKHFHPRWPIFPNDFATLGVVNKLRRLTMVVSTQREWRVLIGPMRNFVFPTLVRHGQMYSFRVGASNEWTNFVLWIRRNETVREFACDCGYSGREVLEQGVLLNDTIYINLYYYLELISRNESSSRLSDSTWALFI